MSVKILQQLTQAKSISETTALQTFYEDEEIDDTLIAKNLQLDSWSSIGIPLTRSAAFDAASIEDKTKYALISSYASSLEYQGTDYVTAWELEYTKMFG